MGPLISVIITSYNYLHLITEAIDSACAQTYPNLEIIVVDNCSTDGTVPVITERYRDDPRVRIFVNERNLGELGNANRGFEHTTGEFVLWLSADDWLLPRHVARLHAVFEREPQLDVVHSGAYFADVAGRIHSIRQMMGQLPFDYVDARDELLEMFLTNCPLCWPTALIRRAAYVEVGLETSATRVADWVMQIRLALAGKRFGYLHDPTTVLRIHGGQQTGQGYVESGRNAEDFIDLLERFLDHPGMERLRGRERGIATLLHNFIEQTKLVAGRDPFSPETYARVDALRTKLLARAGAYEPARVRERRISVIVSNSPSPQLLARSIASVAAQTHPNWEIVILDQGSLPAEEWLRADPLWERITCVRTPVPYEPGRARNYALRLARGEYLAFLDAGNRFAPEHLETLVSSIAGAAASVAATGARCLIETTDEHLVAFTTLGEIQIHRTPDDPAALGSIAPALPLDAVLMYRDVLDRIGWFDEDLPILDDFEYLIRLEAGTTIAFASATTLDVCVHATLRGRLGTNLAGYLTHLDRVYAAHPVSPTVAALRARHRAAVEAATARVFAPPVGVGEIAGLLAAMAGRAVVPAGER